MTVGKLQANLANLDAGMEAMILVNGQCVPIIDVTAVTGAEFIVIRGEANLEPSKEFTVSEQGLLGHLALLGLMVSNSWASGATRGRADESGCPRPRLRLKEKLENVENYGMAWLTVHKFIQWKDREKAAVCLGGRRSEFTFGVRGA